MPPKPMPMPLCPGAQPRRPLRRLLARPPAPPPPITKAPGITVTPSRSTGSPNNLADAQRLANGLGQLARVHREPFRAPPSASCVRVGWPRKEQADGRLGHRHREHPRGRWRRWRPRSVMRVSTWRPPRASGGAARELHILVRTRRRRSIRWRSPCRGHPRARSSRGRGGGSPRRVGGPDPQDRPGRSQPRSRVRGDAEPRGVRDPPTSLPSRPRSIPRADGSGS